jgi:Negative regulator of sigma E activity
MIVSRFSLGLLLFSLAAVVHAGDREARQWLERMSESLATRNYEARFFRVRDERSDGWRIIHRVERGKATERLVSLDGSGREYIRNESEVICYLPDQKTVLVEKRAEESTLLSTVPVTASGSKRTTASNGAGRRRPLAARRSSSW